MKTLTSTECGVTLFDIIGDKLVEVLVPGTHEGPDLDLDEIREQLQMKGVDIDGLSQPIESHPDGELFNHIHYFYLAQ